MDTGAIIKALIILAAFAIIAWAADRYLQMEGILKGIIIFVIICVGVLLMLNAVGVVSV
jgi:hypothetical protein